MADKSGPVLGIDLGTTNSVVAVADGNEARVLSDATGNHLVPSVVSFHPDGHILVGREARERRLVDAENTVYSTKRLLGRPFVSAEVQRAKHRLAFTLQAAKNNAVEVVTRSGAYALPEISAMVLRHLRAIAEEALGEPCERAVVTVPANFNELQRSATAAAGKVAGLEVLRILNEPTAATLAYGYGREEHGSVLVYDLGGGTFDVTILDIDKDALEVISTAGDTFLGGDDVDVALAERLSNACTRAHRFDPSTEPQAFERVRAAAEWAKCRLSSESECTLTLEELFFVDGKGRDVTLRVTRRELDELSRPLVTSSFEVVNEALRACGRRPKEIGHVVLVGGSTRMPLVVSMVREFFGRAPRFERDPDLVVAQGAAIQGWMLGGRAGTAPRTEVARVALRRDAAEPPRAPEPRRKQPAFAPDARAGRAMDDRPARFVEEHAIIPDARPRGVPAPRPGLAAPVHDGAAEGAVLARDLVSVAEDAGGSASQIGTGSPASVRPGRAVPPPPPRPAASAPSASATPTPFVLSDGDFPRDSMASAPARPLSFDTSGDLRSGPTALPEPAPGARPPDASAPGTMSQPVLPMSAQRGPILMDVTPLALAIETVSGFCQPLIARNAPVPTEKTRVFVTGKDDQTAVEIRICQGDSKTFAENEALGSVVLDALAQKKRGEVRIEVTFLIDASGILDVRAIEVETKREQRTRIALKGGLDTAEIAAMRLRQEAEMALGGRR